MYLLILIFIISLRKKNNIHNITQNIEPVGKKYTKNRT